MTFDMRSNFNEPPVLHPVLWNPFGFVAGDGTRMQITDDNNRKFRSTFSRDVCDLQQHIFLSEMPTNVCHNTNIRHPTMSFYSLKSGDDIPRQIIADGVVINTFFEVATPDGTNAMNLFGIPLLVGRVVQSVLVHSFPNLNCPGSGSIKDYESQFDVVVCANPSHKILRFHVPNLRINLPTLAKLRWSLVHALIAGIGVDGKSPASREERLNWGEAVLDFTPGSGVVMVGAFAATPCGRCVRRNKGESFEYMDSHTEGGETDEIYVPCVPPKCGDSNCHQGLVLPPFKEMNSLWRVMPLGELLWRNETAVYHAVRNPDFCEPDTQRRAVRRHFLLEDVQIVNVSVHK
jgi:hypothetical protein